MFHFYGLYSPNPYVLKIVDIKTRYKDLLAISSKVFTVEKRKGTLLP